MTDRVLIPLAGIGLLALDREAFEASLQAGREVLLPSSAAAPGAAVEPLLDADQAAAQLGVTARFLEDYVRAGILPHYKLGRFVRFRVSEIAEHCRVEGAEIPRPTSIESVGRKARFSGQ